MGAEGGLEVVENIKISCAYQESKHDSSASHYTAHAYSSSPLNSVQFLSNV